MMSPPTPLRSNLRDLWMLKPGVKFLNHGSFGALPRQVAEVQSQWRQRIEAEPIEIIGRRRPELIEAAKIPVANRLGMQPGNFGFVTNATEGVNAVLRSLKLQPGDELLTTNHVYHAVRQAMKLVARNAGATCREVQIPLPIQSADEICERVVSAISPATKLLVIDHVTSPTALVFPLEKIITACKEKGVDVLADAAHAPGMLPLNIETIGATYFTANLHKWICAPKGTAILWVAPDHQADVHPTVISHHLDQGFAEEFSWQGTRDLSSWLTAPAAFAFLENLGFERVLAHNHQMAVWAQQLLTSRWNVQPISPMDGSLLGSMVTVPLPDPLGKITGPQVQALQQRLYDEFQIENPLVSWDDRLMLRVSCQVYNLPHEYEFVADTIRHLCRE
jgi:isopenicillin-N epimerase